MPVSVEIRKNNIHVKWEECWKKKLSTVWTSWHLPLTLVVEVMIGVAHVCMYKLWSISKLSGSLSLFHFLLAIASSSLAPQSQQCSFPELTTPATTPMRYISSAPKEQGALMRHGRGLHSSFIILLPPIPTPFYQALAGLCVISSDINQLPGEAGAPIMPY